MFALMMSVVWSGVAWFIRAIVFKAVLYISLFVFCSEAAPYLGTWLYSRLEVSAVGSAFAQLPPAMLYFFGLFKLDVGLPMIGAAWLGRFAIRRLPIIG